MPTVTEQTIIKLDVKIIMLLITLIIATATGWFNLSAKVDNNTNQIQTITLKQEQHAKDYQKMNNAVIKNGVQLNNLETILKENRSDLKYLIRKADNK